MKQETASEMADSLEFGRESQSDWLAYLKQVADMLRKQEKEIESLKSELLYTRTMQGVVFK